MKELDQITVEWPEGADFTPWDMSSRDALMRLSPIHNAQIKSAIEKAINEYDPEGFLRDRAASENEFDWDAFLKKVNKQMDKIE